MERRDGWREDEERKEREDEVKDKQPKNKKETRGGERFSLLCVCRR